MEIKIKKGIDLPIAGSPVKAEPEEKYTHRCALLGNDYHGLRPAIKVKPGDRVHRGSPIFIDKQNPLIQYTSPIAGQVAAIERGDRRALIAVVIERAAKQTQEKFPSYTRAKLAGLTGENIEKVLLESGLWIALRTRPFSKVPMPTTRPIAIFINLMDTNPLALSPAYALAEEDFVAGVQVLAKLARIFICKPIDMDISHLDFDMDSPDNLKVRSFSGKHPAGLSGTHMHFLSPVGRGRTNWTIGYQDVAAIGRLFTTGELMTERILSLAGPQVAKPRPIKTSLGADLIELTEGELLEGENRVISGSVFAGHIAEGKQRFLGRYDLQISVLAAGTEREFMHYLSPGLKKFSTLNIYLSKWFPKRLFNFTTSTNGSPRAMVPIGSYEAVMPLDILPTQLLRYLIVGDIEMAESLGCLELDEEDLALCTFVCPGKYEYGHILRHNLTRIEKENWD